MARYGRKDWLEQGLHKLVAEGVEALTIETMCQQMGVTKGSFYHHFAHREAFLEALLQHWEEHYTSQFIAYSLEGAAPAEQLQRLIQLVVETHGTSETAIRAWAQHDPLARAYQERVDRRRLDFLYDRLLILTGDAARSQSLAQLLYVTLLGAQVMMPPLTSEELGRIYHLLNTAFF